MANYSTLVAPKTTPGSLANWVNRSDLPSAEILFEAQALIYETLRVREMQSRAVLSFPMGVQSSALPAGFLDPLGYQPNGWRCDLPFVHENTLNEFRDEAGVVSTGTPSRWTVIGEAAYVDTLPDEVFSGMLHFYKQPDALSAFNETNFLTMRYPSLLRYACMAKAYEHMKQPSEAAGYISAAEAAVLKANATNEMWRRNQYTPS